MMNLPVPAMAPLLVGLAVVVALAIDLMLRLQRMRARQRLPRGHGARSPHTPPSRSTVGKPVRRPRQMALMAPALGGPGWQVAQAWQTTTVMPLSEHEQAQALRGGHPPFAVTAVPVAGAARLERANDSYFNSRFEHVEDSLLHSRYDSHLDSTLDSTWERQRIEAEAAGLPVALATPRQGRSSLRQHVQAASRSHQEKRLRHKRSR